MTGSSSQKSAFFTAPLFAPFLVRRYILMSIAGSFVSTRNAIHLIVALVSFMAATMLLAFPSQPSAPPVNLNAYDMFIAKGFSEEWTLMGPPALLSKRLTPAPKGRAVRLKLLTQLTNEDDSKGFLHDNPAQHFSLFQRFQYRENASRTYRLPGLALAAIGDNWEIYLNGQLLISEFDLNADGSIRKHRHSRKVLVGLPQNLLRNGENVILIHIYGDPSNARTGLYRSSPFMIGDYEQLQRDFSELYILVLMFIFLAVGLYHINLFVLNRDTYNVFFTLSSIAYFVYFISRTAFVEQLSLDTYLLMRVEYISLYLIFPLFGMLFELILLKRVTRFMKVVAVFNGILVALTMFCSMACADKLLLLWQCCALIPLVYTVFYLFTRSLWRDLKEAFRSKQQGHLHAMGKTLLKKESGNLVLGGIIIFSCIVFDIIDSVFLAKALMVSQYGFTLTIIGLEMVQSNRYLTMQNSIKSLNTELNRRMIDLDIAFMQKSASEKRYRFIVEGSNEIFFTLDNSLRIKSCNDAINPILFYDAKEIIGRQFPDLVHPGRIDTTLTNEILREKMELLETTGEAVTFTASFRSEYMDEPVELIVCLQTIIFEGEKEIIGRMRKQSEDSLLRYLNSEKQQYVISNYIYLAEDVAQRLTRNMQRYVSAGETRLCRTALREMIINAIEHGNMQIGFEEKSHAMATNSYKQLLKERQRDPLVSKRHVSVSSLITAESAEFVVSDEGNGFDITEILSRTGFDPETGILPHGRGITITKGIFDLVEYNSKGNSVRLVKHFTVT